MSKRVHEWRASALEMRLGSQSTASVCIIDDTQCFKNGGATSTQKMKPLRTQLRQIESSEGLHYPVMDITKKIK